MAALESKINRKLDATNFLLRELSSKEPRCRRKLTYQKQALEDQEASSAKCPGDALLQRLAPPTRPPEQAAATSPRPAASRVLHPATRLMTGTRRSAQPSREESNESTREYSELTMTLDYEELKSSTLSTDEDEETAKEMGDLRLMVLNQNMGRARSVQLPPPEDRAVLRQTHSDTRDPDFENQSHEEVLRYGNADSQV